ncbi:NUDIX hydrolase [Thalassotalea profundi]|uniref:ADP-ribose pyrophosphatase YjhB n=1 Tax=Thalassotalea profundi TaxID=2036687 RepID=A0ABQ3IU46_9GAMM|nr:NUDIX hydrolase [Thalassotalea profundi]GHE92990.1 putative ADP-ribose pyrophosphatase YjhB [Thalassotalea profundi]
MENSWLANAKKLQAIAETGLVYAEDKYDIERYSEISDIALKLLSDLGNTSVDVITGLISEGKKGYITPKVDVRGAVFQDNKVLLVQEKSDGLWTLPGGFADVGLSPAENIEKEIFEEAGIAVTVPYLYAVRHKAKGEYTPDILDFYKLFFLCKAQGEGELKAGLETMGAEYFSLDNLPALSRGRTVESDIHNAWRFHSNVNQKTYFD